MNDREYTIIVNKQRITVTKEVYKAYYHCRNRESYLDKLTKENCISFEFCIDQGIPIERLATSVENTIDEELSIKELVEKLQHCLETLDEFERKLITDLYYNGKSERALAIETGIPPMTIHDRKMKILKKLKKLMNF